MLDNLIQKYLLNLRNKRVLTPRASSTYPMLRKCGCMLFEHPCVCMCTHLIMYDMFGCVYVLFIEGRLKGAPTMRKFVHCSCVWKWIITLIFFAKYHGSWMRFFCTILSRVPARGNYPPGWWSQSVSPRDTVWLRCDDYCFHVCTPRLMISSCRWFLIDKNYENLYQNQCILRVCITSSFYVFFLTVC